MENKLEKSTVPASVTTPVRVAEDADATRDVLRLLRELEGEEYRLGEATNAYDALIHLRTAKHSHIVVLD